MVKKLTSVSITGSAFARYKLERMNKEIKRRLKVIGRHPDEHGCLSLVYGISKKFADQQNGFTVSEFERAIWLKLQDRRVETITARA